MASHLQGECPERATHHASRRASAHGKSLCRENALSEPSITRVEGPSAHGKPLPSKNVLSERTARVVPRRCSGRPLCSIPLDLRRRRWHRRHLHYVYILRRVLIRSAELLEWLDQSRGAACVVRRRLQLVLGTFNDVSGHPKDGRGYQLFGRNLGHR